MENNFIQHEILGRFVDGLIAQKYPGQPAENFKEIRNQSIDEVNKKIDMAIYSSLSIEQLEEINDLFENNEENPDVFADFFKRAGVDTEQITKEALEGYAKSFLGGGNE